jgi:hypothetical protein
MDSTVILLIVVGLFSIVCAVLDFDWFFNSRKSQLFVKMFGRNGARIFYALLGIFIIAMGIMSHFAEPGV